MQEKPVAKLQSFLIPCFSRSNIKYVKYTKHIKEDLQSKNETSREKEVSGNAIGIWNMFTNRVHKLKEIKFKFQHK